MPASSRANALGTASTKLGTILVDGRGETVYDFANDTGTRSTCNGACAATWRPVVAPDPLPGSLPGVTGQLGSTTRDDGSKQLTIAGHPLYTFSGDSRPGQTNGQGITLNGGLWNVVSPSGSPVTRDAAPSAPTY
jgi:predicted lipoprotein with Yx(FWY)xxD motif